MPYLHNDRRKILLVDENARIQTLRANILRNYDVEVHTAETLIEAAPLWKTNTYDLIVLNGRSPETIDAVSAEIRVAKPKQRIGVLVGPPKFIRELGGAVAATSRKTAPSTPEPSARPIVPTVAVNPSQWQQSVQKIVADWYQLHTLS